jgi:predicted PurR-regulated permease PerM
MTRDDEHVTNLSLGIALRVALGAMLLIACFVIIRPFLVILLWAIILAVALSGVFEKLVGLVGKRGRAGMVLSLIGIALVALPAYLTGGSAVSGVREARTELAAGELRPPPPPENIEDFPFVGQQIYDAWELASDDVGAAMVEFEPQILAARSWAVGFLTSIGGAVLQTLVALIIASVFLAYAEGGVRTARAIVARIAGDTSEDYAGMAAATITSVAQGVLGVAALQATACAALLFVAGFPVAGLFTVVMFVTATLQVPGIVIMALPIVWAFSNLGTLAAVGFLIAAILVGFMDAPLKATLLGRGVPIPTAVILLGAIGGMASLGMMGLFVGAVILGVGYRLFMVWLGADEAGETPSEVAAEA